MKRPYKVQFVLLRVYRTIGLIHHINLIHKLILLQLF